MAALYVIIPLLHGYGMDQCGGNDRRWRWLAVRAQYRLNIQIALQLICIHFYVDSEIRDYKEILGHIPRSDI